jgi:hypothetical protein
MPFGGKQVPLIVKAIQQLLKFVNPLALFRASGDLGGTHFLCIIPILAYMKFI